MTSLVLALQQQGPQGQSQCVPIRQYSWLLPPLPPGSGVPPAGQKPKLLDQVLYVLRFRHYSYQTEKTYIHWIKRFIFFHGKRHPREMGKEEVEQFLTALAVDRHVSAATQNQALHALLFLYRNVLA